MADTYMDKAREIAAYALAGIRFESVEAFDGQIKVTLPYIAAALREAHEAGKREGLRRAAEIVRIRIPVLPPDGPSSTECQIEYEALGFAMMAILSEDR